VITEDELSELLHHTGDAISLPEGAHEAIRTAARRGNMPIPRRRFAPLRPREFVFAGSGLAAVGALIAVLLTAGGATVPAGVAPFTKSANNSVLHPATSSGTAVSQPAALGPLRAFSHTNAAVPANTSAHDIIATGTLRLTVRSDALSRSVSDLESLAASYGGYVGQSNVVESGSHPGGTLVLDVPAASFQSLVVHARSAGRVRSLTTSDNDVTGQVVDLGARLNALIGERSQLEVLLSKTAKVSDLLQVENEIASVQSQIEQNQGQQRVLNQQIAFSALSVDLAVRSTTHHKFVASGFSHAWHVAISSFVDALKGLVSVLGDVVFAILAAMVLLVLAWLSWRRGWPVIRRRFV
jgi:hypothetical protein